MEERWWGTVSVNEGACLEKQIGPLSVAMKRAGSELQFFCAEHTGRHVHPEDTSGVPEGFMRPEHLKERYLITHPTRRLRCCSNGPIRRSPCWGSMRVKRTSSGFRP